MLQHKTFFEGHRGAVLSLAGNIGGKSFYSSGSEGLIVKWNNDKPNEGEVLLRLLGYVSRLAFYSVTSTLYAAVNHKGIYAIDVKTGKIIGNKEMPTSSFGDLQVSTNHIVLSTKVGEVLILERASFKMTKRIPTELNDFPIIKIGSDCLWHSTKTGLQKFNLVGSVERTMSAQLKGKLQALELMDTRIFVLTENGFLILNKNDLKKGREFSVPNMESIKTFLIDASRSTLLALTVDNEILVYKIEKKALKFMNKTQFEHNGQINCLLWIENHKFVISAGADRKIGVWQFN